MLSSKKQMQHCIRCGYLEPQPTFSLHHATYLPSLQELLLLSLINFLYIWPFLDYTLDQIIDFAIAEFNGSDLSPINLVILDERTNDYQTCLSLLKNEANEEAIEYVQVRSDFESAVVVLKTVETGCGDVGGQSSTRYSGSDGVLRISMRDR